MRDGLALLTWERDSFAYADSYDAAAGRYRALRGGQQLVLPDVDPPGMLVKPEVARRQMDAETVKTPSGDAPAGARTSPGIVSSTLPPSGAEPSVPVSPIPRRFHGSIPLDPTRVGRDASRVAEEVIAHLAGLADAKVRITLEIDACFPQGAPDNIVRTVTENCRTLKFESSGFEES